MSCRRHERGSASIELVLLTPVLVGLLLLVVAFGRIQNARADVEAAARGRRLVLRQRPVMPHRLELQENAAFMEFDRSGFRCDTVNFDVDTARFTADAAVTATVSCGVALGDVSGMGHSRPPHDHSRVHRTARPLPGTR
ncbi:MAG: pilus assembly protein [Acidimicrobiia bacterium]|nr:pilus assembly protein [Acidimicrobiia bacterium]